MYNSCIVPCKRGYFFVQKALLAPTLNSYLYYHLNTKTRAEQLNIISKWSNYLNLNLKTNYSREYCLQPLFFQLEKSRTYKMFPTMKPTMYS